MSVVRSIGGEPSLPHPLGSPMRSSVNLHMRVLPLHMATASEKLHEPCGPGATCKATGSRGPHGSYEQHLSHMPQGPPEPPAPSEPPRMVEELNDDYLTIAKAGTQVMSAITEEFDDAMEKHRTVVMSLLGRHLQQWMVDQEPQHQQTPCPSSGDPSGLQRRLTSLMACAHNQHEQQEVQAVPLADAHEQPVDAEERQAELDANRVKPARLDSALTTASAAALTTAQEVVATLSKKMAWDVNECLFDTSREKALASITGLQQVTRSKYYEWCTGVLIFMNTVFVGIETEYAAHQLYTNNSGGQSLVVTWMSVVIALLFALDISLRWVSEGLMGFFRIADYGWSIFDVVIMILTLPDTIISIISLVQRSSETDNFIGNLSVLRVLRMALVVKIARVIRLMSFFRELCVMIYSIIGSLKQLLWVALILGITFYVFGLTLTTGAVHHLDDLGHWDTPNSQDLHALFGSLSRIFLTLFMSMAGGRSWGEFYILLADLPAQYCALFLVFLTFTIFAVLNIVTGVFVESVLRTQHHNRQIVIAEALDEKKEYLRNLRDLFEEMDCNGDGQLTAEEFEQRLCDERVVAYFKAMKLDVTDTRSLFYLFDTDHDHTVDVLEFLDGCYQLQGESHSTDTKIMKMQLQWLVETFTSVHVPQHTVPNAGGSKWSNSVNG